MEAVLLVIIGKIDDVLGQRVLRVRHHCVRYAWVGEFLRSLQVSALIASTIDICNAGREQWGQYTEARHEKQNSIQW